MNSRTSTVLLDGDHAEHITVSPIYPRNSKACCNKWRVLLSSEVPFSATRSIASDSAVAWIIDKYRQISPSSAVFSTAWIRHLICPQKTDPS